MTTIPTYMLGASDLEMQVIEGLLESVGAPYVWATRGYRRVHPGNAYKADGVLGGDFPSGPVVLVECGGPVLDSLDVVARCDHHNEGDPGFGFPPERFLEGSSLGQVISLLAQGDSEPDVARSPLAGLVDGRGEWRSSGTPLRQGQVGRGVEYLDRWYVGLASIRAGCPPQGYSVRIPKHILLTAAADHCLGAAYAGCCPGVVPGDLAQHRAEQRGAWLDTLPLNRPERKAVEAQMLCVTCGGPDDHFGDVCPYTGGLVSQGTSTWAEALERTYRATAIVVRDLPVISLGSKRLRDARGHDLAELPEVLAQLGMAALYTRHNPHDGSTKIGILGGGAGTVPGSDVVKEFISTAREGCVQGVVVDPESVYGDPERGYAGATVLEGVE